MRNASMHVCVLLLAIAVTGCAEEEPDVEVSETTQAVEQYQYNVAGFTLRLHKNGDYDWPVVIVEGFDPNDEFRPEAYWNDYLNYRGEWRPPHLTHAFRDMLAARGYDVWVVSADHGIAIDSISTNAWRYASQVHPFILNWSGYRPYVLSGFSAGGLIARGAIGAYMSAGQRQAEVRAYVSIDAPHEGVIIPRSMMMYMLDQATCGDKHFTSNGFTDPLSCHDRYVARGLASTIAADLLRIRMYPTCGSAYWKDGQYYVWPGFWNDCKDWGGCDLMDDGEWNKCGDGNHGNYAWYIKSATSWSYLGWFTDIPRYAVGNGGVWYSTASKTTSPAHIMQNDVNNAGDHHLYSDDWDRDCTYWYGAGASQCAGFLQVRGSKDGFMDRLNEVGDGGFFDWHLIKKGNWTFVGHDSAFGVNSGLSWTGRLIGQCAGNQYHDAITAGTREYIVDVLNLTYKGFVEFKHPDGDVTPRDCTCNDGYCGAYEDSYSCSADCGEPATCWGNCGGSSTNCYCDTYCETAGDCCPDYYWYCSGGGEENPY